MPASKSTQSTPKKAALKTTRKPSSRSRPKVITPEPKAVSKDKTQGTKKDKKVKVIRDSFTMPKQEFDKIAGLKKQCLQLGVSIKKSEILRAGLHALLKLTPQQLKIAVSKVEKIKTGRPS